ncbi:MAG: aminotransferase class V-fold PLP-dependent enzyme [Bacteroidota bacterium]
MPLADLRRHFPHTEQWTYLDHASTGPLSQPVMDAVGTFLGQRHRTNPNNYFDVAPTVERARERLGYLLGAPADRVEFAPNTSAALNVLAQGLDWQPGDRIAVPGCEFPANVYPWLGLRARGVELDFVPHERGAFTLDAVEQTLRPETRLVSVSWVQFLSGFRADLAAIGSLCRDRGILFCVDGIQGVGALRIDVADLPVDFLACGGHKWVMGMQGTAFFYVTEALQTRLRPVRGWLNGPLDWNDFLSYPTDFYDDAQRFRGGTLNHAGIVALDAAVGLHLEAGRAWCEAQVLERSAQVAAGLDRLGLRRYGSEDDWHASGIVAAEHPDPEAVFDLAQQRGIALAVRDRKLRLAPTWYNTPDEVDRALEAVADAGKTTVAAGLVGQQS